MLTSRTHTDFYRNTFTFNKEAIKLNSQAVVKFDPLFSGQGDVACMRSPEWNSPGQDVWIPRVSCLQFRFNIRFEPQLFFRIVSPLQLSECLKRSLVFAELWLHLGLIGSLIDQHVERIGAPELCFIVILRDASTVQDIKNLTPPVSVLSYQLSSVDMDLEFALKDSSRTYQVSKVREQQVFVRLLDVALRNLICKNPTRMRGISKTEWTPTTSLSMVAPSTFVPRYAELMAYRIRLLEPIMKSLLMFQNLAVGRPCHSSKNIIYPMTSRSTTEAEIISAGLWMTMAIALQDEQQARRLPPLKPENEHEASLLDDESLEYNAEFSMIDTGCDFAVSEVHEPDDHFSFQGLGRDKHQDCSETFYDAINMYTGMKQELIATPPATWALTEPTLECELPTETPQAQSLACENMILDSHGTRDDNTTELGRSIKLWSEESPSNILTVQRPDYQRCRNSNVSQRLREFSSLRRSLLDQTRQYESEHDESLLSPEDEDALLIWTNDASEEVYEGSGMVPYEERENEAQQSFTDYASMLD